MATRRIGNINVNYTVPEAQLQVYNALGRTAGQEAGQNPTGGGDNFFVKKAKSIENTLGTTIAAPWSLGKSIGENISTGNMLDRFNKSIDDVYKQFGFNGRDDYYKQLDTAEETGNQDELNRLKNIPGLLEALKNQANSNASEAESKAKNYADFRNNSYFGQKVNQNNSKYLGSAINTLSTAVDLTGLGANPLSNAIQGGVEGFADEMEANGGNIDMTRLFTHGIQTKDTDNFDWGRAGQNAAIGAATGAVTGALNKGLSSSLAKKGGNLFKGGNALTATMNTLGSKTALGRGLSTLATGAARGALSGAVGGATGAGLSSALNGVEFGQGVANALQGAVQGAGQGAMTGGVMAGANMALSKTPGVGNLYNKIQNAKTEWDNSGSNFDERLTNTITSGKSKFGNWLMGQPSKTLGRLGNIGDTIKDYTDQGMGIRKATDEAYRDLVRDAYDEDMGGYEGALRDVQAAGMPGETNYQKAMRFLEGGSMDIYAEDMLNSLKDVYGDDFNESVYRNKDGSLKMRDGSPYVETMYKKQLAQRLAKDLDAMEAQNIANNPSTNADDSLDRRAMYNITQDDYQRELESIALGQAMQYPNQTLTEADVIGEFRRRHPNYKIIDNPSTNADTPTTAKSAKGGNDYFENEWRRSENNLNILGNTQKKGGQYYVTNENNGKTWVFDTEGQEASLRSGVTSAQLADTNNRVKVVKNGDWNTDYAVVDATTGDVLYEGLPYSMSKGLTENEAQAFAEGYNAQIDARNANVERMLKWESDVPSNAKGWLKKAGQRIIEDANKHGLGLSVQDVSNDVPEDIRNMQIRDYNAYSDGGETPAQDALSRKYTGMTFNEADLQSGTPAQDAYAQGRGSFSDALNEFIEQGGNIVRDRNGNLSLVSPQTTSVDPWDRLAQQNGYRNYDEVIQRYMEANPNAQINPRGMAGAITTWMDNNPGDNPTTAGGWAKKAGQRLVEDINNRGVGLSVKDVSDDNPERMVYNALAGDDTEAPLSSNEYHAKQMRNAQGLKLLSQYGTVDQPMARATNAPESLQAIAEAGFTKPADVEKMADVITGSNGVLSKLTKNLIKNAAPVNTFEGADGMTLEDYIDNSIQLHDLNGLNEGKAVKSTIEANLRSLPSRREGSVTYTDTPEDTFKLVQNLEATAAELKGRGGSTYHRPDIKDIHQAAVVEDVANLLKDRLFDGADVKSALTADVADNLKSYDPNNKKWASHVDNNIMQAETIQDLRGLQKPWVRMKKYIDNAYIQAATAGGRMAMSASDLSRILTTKNGLAKYGIDLAWNSNLANRGKAAIYGKLADMYDKSDQNTTPNTKAGWAKQAGKRAAEDLGNRGAGLSVKDVNTTNKAVATSTTTPPSNNVIEASYNPATKVYDAIGRAEGISDAEQINANKYIEDATQALNAESGYAQPLGASTSSAGTDATTVYNALTGTPTINTGSSKIGYFEPTGDYWTDILASALSKAIDDNDVDAFATLYDMYQGQLSNLSKASSSTSTQKLTSTQQRANAAMNSLERLSSMTPDLAYNLSSIPVVGNIATLGGNDYEAEAKSLAQQIGYMVSGSNIKDSEAENIGKSYVPQPWDNEEVRKNKLRRAYEIIQQYQNGYVAE